ALRPCAALRVPTACRSGVAADVVLAHDGAPDPHLILEELAQLLRPAEPQVDLLSLGELLRDPLVLERRDELGTEAVRDRLRGSGGRDHAPPGARTVAGKPGRV